MKDKVCGDKKLKMKVKELLAKAKEKDLIKSHVLAFNDTPVEKEEHKGDLNAFYRQELKNNEK